MTTIGAAIGVEATSLTIATSTFPIPMPYRRAIEAATTDPDMRAEFVHRTLPVVTPHLMQAATALSTTPAPAHITRLPRARLPIRGTSGNQPFQSLTNYAGSKTAIRQRIGRLKLVETRSTIRRRPGATPLTISHRSIQGTIRCGATAIQVMSLAVAAIMLWGPTGLADKPRSSATEAGPVTAEAEVFEAVEGVFTAVEVEAVAVAGERHFMGNG